MSPNCKGNNCEHMVSHQSILATWHLGGNEQIQCIPGVKHYLTILGQLPFPPASNTHFWNPNIPKNPQEKCKQVGFFVKVKNKLVGVVIGLFLDFKCAFFIAFKARTFIGEVRSE